ncbi:unnamed protein product [Somion occarium]|uniref:Uncharacterized protein n=1 Tax=Somion occarium TaxID=3059160 RepID=A0ABP1CS74_9APHY
MSRGDTNAGRLANVLPTTGGQVFLSRSKALLLSKEPVIHLDDNRAPSQHAPAPTLQLIDLPFLMLSLLDAREPAYPSPSAPTSHVHWEQSCIGGALEFHPHMLLVPFTFNKHRRSSQAMISPGPAISQRTGSSTRSMQPSPTNSIHVRPSRELDDNYDERLQRLSCTSTVWKSTSYWVMYQGIY